MPPAVKFCGITRSADAACAAGLGAAYVGVVFADSPRRVDVSTARELYAAARDRSHALQPVAVFGDGTVAFIASAAGAAGAAVVQLHGYPDDLVIQGLRERFGGEIWSVVRVTPDGQLRGGLPRAADAVVLDTSDAVQLGGTGRAFDWGAVAETLASLGRPRKIVLAGGLRPSNVGEAVRLLLPDVVDVSSGVESSAGIKDHALMRDFVDAVTEAGCP